jgi:hypothetical protein
MLNEHYFDLLNGVSALVSELSDHQDPVTAEKVVELLRHVDLVHREGLLRLIDGLRAQGAGDAVERVVEEDAVVRVLLGLYGLADLQLPSEDEQPPAAENAAAPGFFPIEHLKVRRSLVRADADAP